MRTELTHKIFLALALPFIFSTVTQPLLGAVDTAVVGRLGNAALIAGVSVGAVIFNTFYWLFGFLRVSTTAMSAQAHGMRNVHASVSALVRPALVAGAVALFFLLFQIPLFSFSMRWITPEPEVQIAAFFYYRTVIWGAPFVLLNYVVLGWLMGQGQVALSLIMQVGGNLLNIVLDLFFVNVFDMGVSGVAAATLISQGASFLVGLASVFTLAPMDAASFKEYLRWDDFCVMLRGNMDLMLRTLCVLVQINVFTASGAALGTEILSANAILYHMMMVMSYSLDGIANAASVFAGRALGARDTGLLRSAWRETAFSAVSFSILMAICFGIFGENVTFLFTDLPTLLVALQRYHVWASVFPFAACAGVAFYGIFTGTGHTGELRNSTMAALLIFLAIRCVFVPIWGNHGLWLTFIGFYAARSILLLAYRKRIFDDF